MPDEVLFEPLASRNLTVKNRILRSNISGRIHTPRPCTYCNQYLVNIIENPLGCYDETRFNSRSAMIVQFLSVYQPAASDEAATHA